MSLSADRVVEVLRAAGEPTRLRILSLLRREELSVMELALVLGQSQPRVSRHLKLLTEAEIVERFPDGSWVFYRLGGEERAVALAIRALDAVDRSDVTLARDAEQLTAVRDTRETAAADYFARNAARWDEIRSLYVAEEAVEAAVLAAAGEGPFNRLVDLGTGSGRMLRLLGPQSQRGVGLDQSQQMLNIARAETTRAGLATVELRHGDVFDTRLPSGWADLVVVHQVLHYLSDPAAAVAEAARLVAPDGRLLIVDFAPHGFEFLRAEHQHRRLGFADAEMGRWLKAVGLTAAAPMKLPPEIQGLTVTIWSATRPAERERQAA